MKKNRTLYVSPYGSDSWPGTAAEFSPKTNHGPFATLAKAQDHIRQSRKNDPKDTTYTVNIRGGVYHLQDTLVFDYRDSGNSKNAVTYKNYQNEVPLLDAGRQVNGWQKVDHSVEGAPAAAQNNLWVAAIPKNWRFSQLSFNGTYLPISCTSPDDDWHTWPRAPLDKTYQSLNVDGRKLSKKDNYNCAVLNFLPTPYTFWSNEILDVVSIDRKQSSIEFAKITLHRPEVLKMIPWRLENCASGLKEPGNWFLDYKQGRLYLWPRENQDPNEAVIVAPYLPNAILFKGNKDNNQLVKNIKIQGLEIRHTNDRFDNKTQGKHATSAAIELTDTECCEFRNLTIRNISGNAITGSGHIQHNLFTGNHIFNGAGAGITISGSLKLPDASCRQNTMSDNHIHDLAKHFWHSQGVGIGHGEKNIIKNNLIYNLPYTGITTGGLRHRWFENWPRPRPDLAEIWKTYGDDGPPTIPGVKKLLPGHNIIENNILHHTMMALDDGAAIYCHAGHHNVVRNNYVYHTGSESSHGLYFDDEEMSSTMENNLVINCPNVDPASRGSALHLHNNPCHTIKNNVFIGNNRLYSIPNTYGGHNISNNLFIFGSTATLLNTPCPVQGRKDGRRAEFWTAGPSKMDHNLFWCANDKKAMKEYMKIQHEKGYDLHSIVADPKLKVEDIEKGIISFAKNSPIKKIGFKPIKRK